MAIIDLPNAFRFARQVDWTLDTPAQINRSGYSGQRSVVVNPWHGKWTAKIEVAPIVGEANVLAWRAFLARLRGAMNTFRLPASEGAQNSTTGVTTTETLLSPGATVMTLQGVTQGLLTGQFITVNDQLLCITQADPVGVFFAGQQTVFFEPALRVATLAGTAVETSRPTCLVALTDSARGYSVSPGQIYNMQLAVEEVIAAPTGPYNPEGGYAVDAPPTTIDGGTA